MVLDDLSLDVVVVDNASTDDTASILKKRRSSVTVLSNTTNRGFAAAVNQGAGFGSGRWILLLNPDCLVTPTAIANLVRFRDPTPGTAATGVGT